MCNNNQQNHLLHENRKYNVRIIQTNYIQEGANWRKLVKLHALWKFRLSGQTKDLDEQPEIHYEYKFEIFA